MNPEYDTLKTMTEKRLNAPLCDCIFSEALAAGRRKLDWIISREGDADGKRREDWYLVELIYEHVHSLILSEYYRRKYEEKTQKEKAPRQPASAPIPNMLICSVAHIGAESKFA